MRESFDGGQLFQNITIGAVLGGLSFAGSHAAGSAIRRAGGSSRTWSIGSYKSAQPTSSTINFMDDGNRVFLNGGVNSKPPGAWYDENSLGAVTGLNNGSTAQGLWWQGKELVAAQEVSRRSSSVFSVLSQ